MQTIAVILAAGRGKRTGLNIPKQFIKIAGKTILEHTLQKFINNKKINSVVLVINKEDEKKIKKILDKNNWKIKTIFGGETRQESSYNALKNIKCNPEDKILIHDSVRPFVSDRIINEIIEELDKYDAIDTAIPSHDTIIKINDSQIIEDIPKRKYMYLGQTPQGFKYKTISKAHELAKKEGYTEVTDDCGLVLKYNLCPIKVVKGDTENMKITYIKDIYLADKIFFLRTKKIENTNLDFLNKKQLIVFGGTSGIGKEIVNITKKYGGTAIALSRRNGVDVRNKKLVREALKKIKEKYGKINYVINTAAVLKKGPLEKQSYEEIIEQVNTNYIGSIIITKEAIPYIKETKGHILLFSSSSYTYGRENYSIYSSTKAALVNFVQAVSKEVDKYGVKINIVSPERTKTPMRIKNFGYEKEGLLDPKYVAEQSLKILNCKYSGINFDIKLMDRYK